MSGDVYHWIGVGTVGALLTALIVAGLLLGYALLLHGRFELIPFRRTQRRLSIASWYSARLMSDPDFHADDFPVNERPFLLSYLVGQRRLFLMVGLLSDRRHMPISGKHPEYDQ